MVNPTTSPLIFSKLLYNIYLPLPIFLPPTNKNYLVIFLNPSPPELPFLRSLPYISLRKTQGRCPKDGGVNKTEGLKNSNSNKIKSQPLPLPCPVTLQGVTYKIGAEAKGKYISPSSPVWRRHIGEVARSDGGVKKTEELKTSAVTATNRVSPSPLAVPRSITGCFVQQNIGEVSEGRRG